MTSPPSKLPSGTAGPFKGIGLKAILRFALYLFLLPLVLFATAGHLSWPMGWVFVSLYFVSVFASRLIVMRRFPDLLSERAQFLEAEGTMDWERVLAPLMALFGLLILIIAGLDKRFDWSPTISYALQLAAIVPFVLGLALSTWAMSVNRFFSAVVRIQKDRGHTVATDGPYRLVRHPAYAGGILSQLAVPIMLESLWALIPAVVVVAVNIVRTHLEDKELIGELAGYSEFAQKTRYRLVPGIW